MCFNLLIAFIKVACNYSRISSPLGTDWPLYSQATHQYFFSSSSTDTYSSCFIRVSRPCPQVFLKFARIPTQAKDGKRIENSQTASTDVHVPCRVLKQQQLWQVWTYHRFQLKMHVRWLKISQEAKIKIDCDSLSGNRVFYEDWFSIMSDRVGQVRALLPSESRTESYNLDWIEQRLNLGLHLLCLT